MRIIDVRDGFDRTTIEALIGTAQAQTSVDPTVAEILKNDKERGDAALCAAGFEP